MPAKCDRHSYNDLREILALRQLVGALNADEKPAARLVCAPSADAPERAAVLAGSFNPLTSAHTGLARAAKRATRAPVLYFLLSKVTVDKERITGASLEDRLLVLKRYALTQRGIGVLLANRGLYVEQAAAIRQAFPALRDLYFVIGFDKLLQIFDARYYADREAALGALFDQAAFLVAPRGAESLPAGQHGELARLLERPENRRFRDKVVPLVLPAGLGDLSSTLVRAEAAAGVIARAAVPPQVSAFMRATGVYLPPVPLSDGELLDRYDERARLVALLAAARPSLQQKVNLDALLALASADDDAGRSFRRLIRDEPAAAIEVLERLAR